MPLLNSKLSFLHGLFLTIISLFSAALQDICSFTRIGWHWLCQLLHYSTYHHCRPVWGRKKDHSFIYLLHLHSSGKVGFLAVAFGNSVWPHLQFNIPWALIRSFWMYFFLALRKGLSLPWQVWIELIRCIPLLTLGKICFFPQTFLGRV